MSAGAIDIIYGGAVPDETKKVTSLIREAIVKGEFKPFTGELKDQDGKVHNKPDEELDLMRLLKWIGFLIMLLQSTRI